MNEDDPRRWMEEEVERIVRRGEDVREGVRDALAAASAGASETSLLALDLSRSALDGALRALDRAAPKEQDRALRQVVDGLGDGLARTAQAARLTLEEAMAQGRAYAQEDVRRVADDLRGVSKLFVETVTGAIARLVGQGSDRFQDLRSHTMNTRDAIEPSLRSALEAIARDPTGMAQDSARAAFQLGREGAGALLRAVGELLERAGDRLSPPQDRQEPGA